MSLYIFVHLGTKVINNQDSIHLLNIPWKFLKKYWKTKLKTRMKAVVKNLLRITAGIRVQRKCFIPLILYHSRCLFGLQEQGSSAGYLVCGLGWMKGTPGRGLGYTNCVFDWCCVCKWWGGEEQRTWCADHVWSSYDGSWWRLFMFTLSCWVILLPL